MEEHRRKKLLDQIRACPEFRRSDAIRLRLCAYNTEDLSKNSFIVIKGKTGPKVRS